MRDCEKLLNIRIQELFLIKKRKRVVNALEKWYNDTAIKFTGFSRCRKLLNRLRIIIVVNLVV